jgi:carboxymethylenebutenolidase
MASFETIVFGADGARAHVLAAPASASARAAVIVLQEWWGVNDVVLAHARRVRDALGVTVLVPDLYRGSLGVDVEEAHHLMTNMDWGVATNEIREAASWLRAERKAERVGVVGFCMGGALALIAAAKANVDCAVPFYGIPGEDACDVSAIAVPVQGHFGEKDNLVGFSDPESAKKLRERLRGEESEVHLYENVGHAFMNTTPQPYPNFEEREKVQGFPKLDESAVELAWSRAEAFLRKHLRL